MTESIYQRCRIDLARYRADQPGLSGLISLNQKILDIQESVRAQLGPAPPVSETGLANLRAGQPALNGIKVNIPAAIFLETAEKLAAEFSLVAGQTFPVDR